MNTMADEKPAGTEVPTPEPAPAPEVPDAAEVARLRQLAAERDEYLDLAQRLRAEFENYQKRNQKDRELERRYAYTPLLFDLLPVYDNLERTLQAAQQGGDSGALVQGVAMVQNQFLEQLKRHGVTRIEAQGKPFDPNLHQAVMQQEADELEENTVVQVLEHGFMNHDRVLRPAKVIVSKKRSA
ncbi:MAG: nucleotide exchange factor GrpE [Gemmataceae bacterium]|nr:nucleotide exchange factor GrpE [Gemmataceae bacterium]